MRESKSLALPLGDTPLALGYYNIKVFYCQGVKSDLCILDAVSREPWCDGAVRLYNTVSRVASSRHGKWVDGGVFADQRSGADDGSASYLDVVAEYCAELSEACIYESFTTAYFYVLLVGAQV